MGNITCCEMDSQNCEIAVSNRGGWLPKIGVQFLHFLTFFPDRNRTDIDDTVTLQKIVFISEGKCYKELKEKCQRCVCVCVCPNVCVWLQRSTAVWKLLANLSSQPLSIPVYASLCVSEIYVVSKNGAKKGFSLLVLKESIAPSLSLTASKNQSSLMQ